MIRYRGDFYVDIDAVQEGARDTAKVVSYLERGASALLLGVTIKSAGATMRHTLQTFLNHGKPNIFTFELEINLLEEAGFYKTNPKTLGEYIRKTRLDRKMSARELAEIIGCSENILLDWERDIRIPRIGHLKRLNEILDVPNSFLREAIAKSYCLSGKERDMLFEFDLIRENLKLCEKKDTHKFGLFLRVYRLSILVNNKEFAKVIGVDASTVSSWENGRHEPNRKMMQRIN